MEGAQFPASAADSLIEGYCDDFISLASILSQTLEQVSMRALDISNSTEHLSRIESGMRDLSEAIRDLIERGRVMQPGSNALNRLLDSEPSVLATAAYADWLSTDPIDPGPDPDLDPDPDPEAKATRSMACKSLAAEPLAAASEATESEDAKSRAAEATTTDNAPKDIRAHLTKDFGIDLSEIDEPDPVTEAQLDAAQPHAAEQACATEGEAPGDADTRRLQGNNLGMPIISVVQFVERMRKTGVMTVELGDETMAFEFDRGFMKACTTNNPIQGERLGDLLVDLANCDANQLESILANPGGEDTTQIGELLVRAGLATNAQVMAALETQAQRRFERACEAKDGDYEFTECLEKPTDGRIHIALTEFASESFRRQSM